MSHIITSCSIGPRLALHKAASVSWTQGKKAVSVTGNSFSTPVARVRGGIHLSRGRSMSNAIGIYYGTTSGSTEAAANMIKEVMTGSPDDIVDIANAEVSEFAGFDGLIVGAPTWNTGSDEMRSMTDWDTKLDAIRELKLEGKQVAVFGLGDSCGYGDYFCDAIEELHDAFAATGAKMIGYVSPDGYDFTESRSVRDGKFLGLPLDSTNEDNLTEGRVKTWTKQLVSEGMNA